MNELERVVLTLVRSIETQFPQYLSASFRVKEIHEQLIPYRAHRAALGVETNEDYELVVTRLLAGEEEYLIAPNETRDALKSELASPNPDSGRYKRLGNVEVRLGPAALALMARTPLDVPAKAPKAVTPAAKQRAQQPSNKPANPGSPRADRITPKVSPQEWQMPPGQRSTTGKELGGKCRYCHGVLPDGRDLTYCPHCGQDLTVYHCPACSTELDVSWKFCVTCGRTVGE